jgi:hypothetical protein
MNRRSLLRDTRQQWKFTTATLVMAVGGAAAIVQFVGPRDWTFRALAAVLLCFAIAVPLLLAIRCPACHKSLGVWAFTTRSVGDWYGALFALEACPRCGHRAPEDEPMTPER